MMGGFSIDLVDCRYYLYLHLNLYIHLKDIKWICIYTFIV